MKRALALALMRGEEFDGKNFFTRSGDSGTEIKTMWTTWNGIDATVAIDPDRTQWMTKAHFATLAEKRKGRRMAGGARYEQWR